MLGDMYISKAGELRSKLSPQYLADRAATLLYHARGRHPFSKGYKSFQKAYVAHALGDETLLERFRSGAQLPASYGLRLDERVIEYPWVLARLAAGPSLLLDAGSTLNFEYLACHRLLSKKHLVIYTLSPLGENLLRLPNTSYLYGDLRRVYMQSNVFDEIVCISTLEHVGLDNTLLYTSDQSYREQQEDGYLPVVRELRRLLKPGGRLLLTVPFGQPVRFAWLQQFDNAMLERLIAGFGGELRDLAFYRHFVDGWQVATAAACADAVYYDNHSGQPMTPDRAAAAQAVACLELSKP